MSMTQGRLPIVVSSAQEITADPISVQAILFNPSAATSSFPLFDNQSNPIAEVNLVTQVPFFIPFPTAIPCVGLSLKAITAGTLMIYPADI